MRPNDLLGAAMLDFGVEHTPPSPSKKVFEENVQGLLPVLQPGLTTCHPWVLTLFPRVSVKTKIFPSFVPFIYT